MERLEGLVQQAVQVEHVRAPPGEERACDANRRVAAGHLSTLEVDEDGSALCRILRLLRQLGHEPGDAIAGVHRFSWCHEYGPPTPRTTQRPRTTRKHGIRSAVARRLVTGILA